MEVKTAFWIMCILFWAIIALAIIQDADAYMISRNNKVIYSPSKVLLNQSDLLIISKEINLTKKDSIPPNNITLGPEEIHYLNNNCHGKEGSIAYQSGWADACDYILDYLRIRENKFKSRPSFINELKSSNNIIFKYDFKQFDLNVSQYRIEWRYNNTVYNLNESTFFKSYNKNLTIKINNSEWTKGYIRVYGR